MPSNDRARIKVVCTACPAFINARYIQGGSLKISSLDLKHTCAFRSRASVKGYLIDTMTEICTRYKNRATSADVVARARVDWGVALTYKQK